MIDDGYIKFNNLLTEGDPPDQIYLTELNSWRNTLYNYGLLGAYDNGVGYGNVSRRFGEGSFIISGSGTGNQTYLSNKEYVRVNSFNEKTNTTESTGLISPSSESMTHGIIYRSSPKVRCVMHVHNIQLWNNHKHRHPTTAVHVAYGTPAMANEVRSIVSQLSAQHPQVIIMGGHKEGIIVYGPSILSVGTVSLQSISELNS